MNSLESLRSVHSFVFDVDGVFTNNHILVLEDGKLLRSMNIRDGYALKKAIGAGYRVAVITGGRSAGVVKRFRALGVEDIYIGRSEKLEAFEELVGLYELDPSGILYMGDDEPDLEVMRRVGVAACPADAIPAVRDYVNYISPLEGGAGCVRDVIEKVLKLNGRW